jgi:hypothetical protein
MIRDFDLFADYHQFLVHDSACDWEDLPDRWTDETVEAMFIQGDGYVAVGTARDMTVPVEVRIDESEKELPNGGWDRIACGELEVPTGEIVVTGVTDGARSGGRLKVAPGEYRVRVLFAGLDSLSEDGLDGDDHYVVELRRM